MATHSSVLAWRIPGMGEPGGLPSMGSHMLAVSGFVMMGLVSGLSLANHSNSESFLVAHASLSQDGC